MTQEENEMSAPMLGSAAKCRPIGAYVHTPTHDDLVAEIARLRLTDAEREAVERGYCSLMGVEDMSAECSRWDAEAAATLRGLLERMGGGR